MVSLEGSRIVVVGGSSGIGLAIAEAALREKAEVVIAGRSTERLEQARAQLGEGVEAISLDFTDEPQVRDFFDKVGAFDHLVITAAQGVAGQFLELECAEARKVFDGKFWGQYCVAHHGASRIRAGGSITFFSSVASRRAMPGLSAMAAANGAIESLCRTLAVELAPIRVNVIAPGVIDTPAHHWMPEAERRAFFEATEQHLPLRRVGTSEDVAAAVVLVMSNGFITGTVLEVDGGHGVA